MGSKRTPRLRLGASKGLCKGGEGGGDKIIAKMKALTLENGQLGLSVQIRSSDRGAHAHGRKIKQNQFLKISLNIGLKMSLLLSIFQLPIGSIIAS